MVLKFSMPKIPASRSQRSVFHCQQMGRCSKQDPPDNNDDKKRTTKPSKLRQGKGMTNVDDYGVSTVVGFSGRHWEVHKFGGTSVQNADCYRSAATIVEEQLGIVAVNNNDTSDISIINDLNLAIVVSAMGGKPKTTDLLLSTVQYASSREDDAVEEAILKITDKHNTCLDALFSEHIETRDRLKQIISKDLEDIRDILKTVWLMKWQAERISELVSGYGELWSAQILCALLQHRANSRFQAPGDDGDGDSDHDQQRRPYFVYLDARGVITIDEDAIKDGAVCYDISFDKLSKIYSDEINRCPPGRTLHFVVTGYVASNTVGVATTLQRDGSDYSAAIMGKLLQSRSITIWTDVDGVLSADPRRVPNSFVIPEVSYDEAMELSFFGAKVIHPKTMQPAILANPQIPIYIRNTFHPAFRGTRIFKSCTLHTDRDKKVCGFSSVEHMALLNVEGSGMIGVPGVAKRVFGTLESAGVNVVLISQSSSEHSITFATAESQGQLAKEVIEEEFQRELKQNRISKVELQVPCSIIAAVGDGMKHLPGIAGRFFSALGDAAINVLAISQGCSERNISAVVFTKESTKALRAVHAAFRLSYATVRVGVIGMDELGESLLTLLQSQRAKLRDTFDIDLQVCSVLDNGTSPSYVGLKNNTDASSTDSVTLSGYKIVTGVTREDKKDSKSVVTFDNEDDVVAVRSGGMAGFNEDLYNEDCAHHVIFDCTGEEEVSNLHADWLNKGIHVVTANNWGLGGPIERSDAISKAERAFGKFSAEYNREVTVGGALPIISTIRSLLTSGDKIRRIDGIISVSMSYILFRVSPPPGATRSSEFDEEFSRGAFRGDLTMSSSVIVGEACPFSQAVEEAVALGLMEEDPASDFNNEYSSRCLMILARELGLERSTTSIDIQEGSDKLVDPTSIDFKNISQKIDNEVHERVESARQKGCVLRQIASVDVIQDEVQMRLVEVPNSHVFAVTPPSCACMRFFTMRHRRYPLIIQGPSAGADSTASALLAEFLSHMRSKVGPQSGRLSRANSMTALSAQRLDT